MGDVHVGGAAVSCSASSRISFHTIQGGQDATLCPALLTILAGKRDYQEDDLLIDPQLALFAVFDGHGGWLFEEKGAFF